MFLRGPSAAHTPAAPAPPRPGAFRLPAAAEQCGAWSHLCRDEEGLPFSQEDVVISPWWFSREPVTVTIGNWFVLFFSGDLGKWRNLSLKLLSPLGSRRSWEPDDGLFIPSAGCSAASLHFRPALGPIFQVRFGGPILSGDLWLGPLPVPRTNAEPRHLEPATCRCLGPELIFEAAFDPTGLFGVVKMTKVGG